MEPIDKTEALWTAAYYPSRLRVPGLEDTLSTIRTALKALPESVRDHLLSGLAGNWVGDEDTPTGRYL